ncbi:4-hydroxy-tetrahydrodipicolinate synthase [Marinicauda pacifica]|uniref:4-hydroxy-tetrahydrodipicolinate synthase n=1 Tax=Marinicauda pacifica TaxID=1133559 RepID=A0A4S2HFD2_9PROT|nr:MULTISPECIES: 4-hydroxy-tetrahydrodipicolinate synthase [Marinicauda]TGY94613.1 4-hydroxy-tetrahydrodipicolinate synthase [Marinicauda pacifica]GGE37309.1 4-hydroxy-tetrahydrodipicolinate synthase [Marinicauda pacifica]
MFRGSFTALVTPFRDGAVDWAAYEALIERQIEAGTHGLVPGGTTAETPTLSEAERRDVIERTVKIAGGRIPVIAGTGTNATASTIEWQRFAKSVGVDAGLVVAPYYNKPSQAGLLAHFNAVADAVALPIVIYNIPGRSVVDILPETMARMAEHPNIIGVKDASGDVARVTRHRNLIGPDFIQLSGEDDTALGYNAHGGHGIISVTANVAPRQCAEFQTACLEGDWDRARTLNDKLQALHEVLFAAPSPAPSKYALSLMGLCAPEVRLPLVECPEPVRQGVRQTLEELELL